MIELISVMENIGCVILPTPVYVNINKHMHMNNNTVTYRDILLKSALRENTVEFRSQLPLRQDGKHHTLQHHGLRPLKTHNSKKLNSSTFEVWEQPTPPPPVPISALKWNKNRMRNETKSFFWSQCLKTWTFDWGMDWESWMKQFSCQPLSDIKSVTVLGSC